MLAIITGTIRPNCDIKQLYIRDEEERLKQYIECLDFYVKSGAFSKIIFCENSGFGVQEFQKIIEEASDCNVKLEILSFKGNEQKIKEHGKGYGEGEIMEYVFCNSALIKNIDYFVKITGRLKVVNIKKIVKSLNKQTSYFNIPNKILNHIYDTRIYAISVQSFIQHFSKVYTNIMDDQGIYLEHVYTEIIKEKNLKITNFPWFPRIKGISGSGGTIYDYREWKCLMKDVLSKFNYYKIKD